jgi:hypothetical protein
MTTEDNCQKHSLDWMQNYVRRATEDILSEWNYHTSTLSATAKHRYQHWSDRVKSQYDRELRLGRVFRWSHKMRTPARKTVGAEFKNYADKWWKETRILSSIQGKIFNQYYQRIIGMGKPVLPFIFADLERRGGQWYWALECITGENPADSATNLDQARRMWLDYAAKNGYLRR